VSHKREGVARIIDIADLAHGETSYEFEGHHYGDTRVSFILTWEQPTTQPCEHLDRRLSPISRGLRLSSKPCLGAATKRRGRAA
jgi:hypothetical protein